MDKYLEDDEQKNLKGMLYSYLKDKAGRRAGVTSKNAYEGGEKAFLNQMQQHDLGSLAGALSEAGSMAGTIGGKRAESDIIPKMNEGLYKSTQGAYENFRTMRDMEERSNMNDLRVADYITGIESRDDANKLNTRDRDFRERQYNEGAPDRDLKRQMLQKQLSQQALTKRNVNSNIMGPDGQPVLLDQEGNPTNLDGYKFRPARPVGAGSTAIVPMPGYEDENGNPIGRDSSGRLVPMPLPSGAKKVEKPGAAPKSLQEAQYRKESLVQNANKLKALVNEHGTMDFFGPEGSIMDKIIYEMAIDYAKLVDPDSVAREGEVASAKKYMLPIRNLGGATTKNSTAISLIDDYISGLDTRMKARMDSVGKGGDGSGGGMTPEQKARLQELRQKHRK